VACKRLTRGSDEAAALHARTLISLNCSLNGDLNSRVFQVLSSGGFLLTDRLSPQAGLERLFRDGEHLICYDGVEDLQQKIEHYLNHPREARQIARAGRDEYRARHRPAQKIAELIGVLGGDWPATARIEARGRTASHPPASPQRSEARVAVYEQLQELHRSEVGPSVMFTTGVDSALVADAVELPRMRVLVDRERGIADERVSSPGAGEVEAGLLEFDVVVTTADAITSGSIDRLIDHTDSMVLEGEVPADHARGLDAHLRARGFERSRAALPVAYHLKDEVTIGERHFAAGEPEEAVKHFRAALSADPEDVRALNNLGVVSHLFGERMASVQFLERALSLDRRDPETLLNLAEAKLQLGDLGEARRLYHFLERRNLAQPVLRERRLALRAELEASAAAAPSPPAPAAEDELAMPIPPSLRRLRIALAPGEGAAGAAPVLVEALISLAAKGTDFRCTLAGLPSDPERLQALRRTISDAGLDDRFALAGPLEAEAWQDLLGRSNVLAFPVAVRRTEATAAGLAPVPIGTDAGALADLLEALPRDRERWRRLGSSDV
jgi:hypothetical protein